jgi:transposase
MSRQYTDEFREEAVGLVLESKSSITEVARDLGVSAWTLRGWVNKYRQRSRLGQPRRAETVEEENRRLKRELAMLRQERDILKKAAAYFAKEQL